MHVRAASKWASLGDVLRERRRHHEAVAHLRAALSTEIALYGDADPDVARTRTNLGNCLAQMGSTNQAEPLLLRAADVFESHFAPDHPDLGHDYNGLAVILRSGGLGDVARKSNQEALRVFETCFGPGHYDVVTTSQVHVDG